MNPNCLQFSLQFSLQDGCYRFSLDQMQRATSNFHDELVIGKGGFGNVYKGTFEVGPTTVAIKRLHSRSKQGPLEFRTEIEMLSKFRHSHLVSLIGYCDDGYEMILVYEFMPGGTLADHLYKKVRQGDQCTPTLSWVQRLKVCIGAARGLDYLHTGTGIQHRIIHRDVKTTNILLDENLEAKISDFGLSKLSPANQAITDVSTHVKGTFGYLDPYYFSTHRLTKKSDVYSFGVVLFEVLCGRPAVDITLDTEQMGLADWAQHCFREGLLGNIIDPKIKDEVSPDCLEAFVKVAVQCLQFGPKHRPNMAEVVVALESALVLQETTDSEKRTVDVSKGIHQEKQSSTRMTFTERVTVYKGHMQNFLQALGGREVARTSPDNLVDRRVNMTYEERTDFSNHPRHMNDTDVDYDYNLEEDGPGIEGFQIIGDAIPGSKLLGCGYPVRGTSLCMFQWVRHNQDGTPQFIEGATNPEYTITADDVDKLIAVECIPMNDQGQTGEIVRLFANDQNKITCDPEMQQEIDTYTSEGEAVFNVLLSLESYKDWEQTTLILQRTGYQIQLNKTQVVISESFSVDLSINIPWMSSQFSIRRSNGSPYLFNANSMRFRDTIVLTMRIFQSKASDEKLKGIA